jgi:hypothetical protein
VAFGAGSVARRPPASPDTDELLDRTAHGDRAARHQLLAGHRRRLCRAVACRLDPRLVARVDAPAAGAACGFFGFASGWKYHPANGLRAIPVASQKPWERAQLLMA